MTSPASRRKGSDLDPRQIRLTNAVGWFWLAVCLIGVLVITVGFAPHLPASVWLFLPAGRGSGPSAHAWRTGDLIATAWVVVLVFGATLAASRRWSMPTRAWLLVAVIVMAAFFSAGIVGAVADSAQQLGIQRSLTTGEALAAISPLGGVTTATGLVALVTILAIPALFKNRLGRSRPRTKRTG